MGIIRDSLCIKTAAPGSSEAAGVLEMIIARYVGHFAFSSPQGPIEAHRPAVQPHDYPMHFSGYERAAKGRCGHRPYDIVY